MDLVQTEPPQRITDIKKAEHMMKCDRTLVDFAKEIKSMTVHEEYFQRPRLSQIIQSVYIPKLKAKQYSAYLY